MKHKPTPKVPMSDNYFAGIITPIACFIAGFGAYAELLPIMVLGIMLPPIAFTFRRRYSV
jgi:hypothetical protein